MSERFEIRLSGCDDSTAVEMELTEDEWETATRIADQVTRASEYSCQPRMRVERVDDPHPEDEEQSL